MSTLSSLVQVQPLWLDYVGVALLGYFGAGLHRVILAGMTEGTPICAREGYPLEWWIESDNHGLSGDPNHKLPPPDRENHTRGQILCYDCPFLVECRRQAWGEPAHVWAGLNYLERYKAREEGAVLFKLPKYLETYEGSSHRSVIKKRFLAGESLSDIAVSMDRRMEAIWYHVRRVLVQARLDMEGTLWNEAPPPPFGSEMNRQRFRHGAASSSGWVVDRMPDGLEFS